MTKGHLYAQFDRPTTGNLLQRDISSDADVAEAMSQVRDAQSQLAEIRGRAGGGIGDLAKKYSRQGSGNGGQSQADILVINHDD